MNLLRTWLPWAGLALLVCLAAPACSRSESGAVDAGADGGAAACGGLFGRPSADTGLTAEQCTPACGCPGSPFAPPAYDEAFTRGLLERYVLVSPPAPLTTDPYAGPAPAEEGPDTVCGVLLQGDGGAAPRPYTLVTYASAEAAGASGARVTHFGRCGLCSTLADLAVYVRNNDLTAPVRSCGFRTASDGGSAFEADLACLRELGFSPPCAQIWAYNTSNTRAQCLSICLQGLLDSYNLASGALSPCLACDEEKSGPVFKAVAGRTRRNSGLPNAICRPCAEVRPLLHAY